MCNFIEKKNIKGRYNVTLWIWKKQRNMRIRGEEKMNIGWREKKEWSPPNKKRINIRWRYVDQIFCSQVDVTFDDDIILSSFHNVYT